MCAGANDHSSASRPRGSRRGWPAHWRSSPRSWHGCGRCRRRRAVARRRRRRTAATASTSKSANAGRKAGRLRRMISQDSPDWNASSDSRSNSAALAVQRPAPLVVVVGDVLRRGSGPGAARPVGSAAMRSGLGRVRPAMAALGVGDPSTGGGAQHRAGHLVRRSGPRGRCLARAAGRSPRRAPATPRPAGRAVVGLGEAVAAQRHRQPHIGDVGGDERASAGSAQIGSSRTGGAICSPGGSSRTASKNSAAITRMASRPYRASVSTRRSCHARPVCQGERVMLRLGPRVFGAGRARGDGDRQPHPGLLLRRRRQRRIRRRAGLGRQSRRRRRRHRRHRRRAGRLRTGGRRGRGARARAAGRLGRPRRASPSW